MTRLPTAACRLGRRTSTALVAALLGLFLAFPARAEPVDPALQQELLGLFDRYNKAILAGKLDDAVALRTTEMQKTLKKEMASPAKKKEFLETSKLMAPDSVELKHARAKGGAMVSLMTVATRTVPRGLKQKGAPPAGTVLQSELTLDFVKEASGWRFEAPVWGMDPREIKPCKNESFEPVEAYDDESSASVGGPIRRVAFRDDHTLVVIRIVDEEACAFLPDRATLEAGGFKADRLVPYAIVEGEALEHRSDKQKYWLTRISVVAD